MFAVVRKFDEMMLHPVTQAAEKTILSAIKAKYKDHLFIAEESTASDPLTDAPTWVHCTPVTVSPPITSVMVSLNFLGPLCPSHFIYLTPQTR